MPEYGYVDSATFTVAAGAVSRVRAAAVDTALDIGATATLRARVVDRYGNPRSEVPALTVGPGSAVTLDVAAAVV